jgi:putative transposase
MDIGPSEVKTFWTEFLRKLRRRGLRGVKLVVSDAHDGRSKPLARSLPRSGRALRERLAPSGYTTNRTRPMSR